MSALQPSAKIACRSTHGRPGQAVEPFSQLNNLVLASQPVPVADGVIDLGACHPGIGDRDVESVLGLFHG